MQKTVVIGPPGSGKTYWAMQTVKGLIQAGVHPQHICLVTFTTVAAREIKDRLRKEFPVYSYDDFCWVGTIHSICRRLLSHPVERLFAGKQVMDFAGTFHYSFNGVLLGKTTEDIEVQDQMLVSDADWFDQFDGWTRNSLCPDWETGYQRFFNYFDLSSVPQRFTQGTLKLYLKRKAEYLADKGLLDFPGLIEEVIRRAVRPPIKYLLCDEFQDNSSLLNKVLYQWGEQCEEMIAIGDPDQSIYSGFLPADPEEFLRFAQGARRVDLQNSQRLPRAVQRISESWISRNRQRLPRVFNPRPSEGLVKDHCRLKEMPLEDWATHRNGHWSAFLISRTRRQATEQKLWLQERGIPFATNRGEENPLQTPKGEFALAILKLMDGDKIDMADLSGVIKWVPSKPWLGHGAKKRLEERIQKGPADQVAVSDLPTLGFSGAFLNSLRDKDWLAPLKFTEVEKLYLRRVYSRFGRQVFTQPPRILCTNFHGVKGMEAQNVVMNLDLPPFPARMMMEQPEDERRVAYVALTRAKEALYMLWPERDTYYHIPRA